MEMSVARDLAPVARIYVAPTSASMDTSVVHVVKSAVTSAVDPANVVQMAPASPAIRGLFLACQLGQMAEQLTCCPPGLSAASACAALPKQETNARDLAGRAVSFIDEEARSMRPALAAAQELSMALKPCRECKQIVGTDAKTCPHCGISDPTALATPTRSTNPIGCLGVLVIGGLIAWFISSSHLPPTTPTPKIDANSTHRGRRRSKGPSVQGRLASMR